jgi:uncharacterized membrane protein YfcA
MNQTVLFILASIGMTHIIIDGSIFSSLRYWIKNNLPEKIAKLFECYMCLGFWCGMIIGAGIVSQNPVQIFACGCAGSLLSQLTAIILNLLEAAIIKLTSTE